MNTFNLFLTGLPSALVFGGAIWGVTYLLMISLSKIAVRSKYRWIHFCGTVVLLAFMFAPGLKVRTDVENFQSLVDLTVAAIFLSIISCAILRSTERKHQRTAKNEDNG